MHRSILFSFSLISLISLSLSISLISLSLSLTPTLASHASRAPQGSHAAHAARAAPNIVLFLVDDLGYGDIQCYGNDTIRTPAVDALAASGVRLTQMLSGAPICTPSRASLLTGRYAARLGMASSNPKFRTINSPAQSGGLPLAESTVAEELVAAGYATAAVGKWHLGMSDGAEWTPNGAYLPRAHGFQSYYGMPVTNVQACDRKPIHHYPHNAIYIFVLTYRIWLSLAALIVGAALLNLISSRSAAWAGLYLALLMWAVYYYSVTYTLLNPASCVLYKDDTLIEQPVRLQNLTRRLVDKATSFVHASASAETPFFLYMPFVKVHTALFTSPAFAGRSRAGEYVDNVEEMDWAVGQVLHALETAGVRDNTLVIFTSDNGPFRERFQEGGSPGGTPNGQGEFVPFRGGKGQVWEGGFRVPGIFSWPAVIPSGSLSDVPVSHLDILPTILDAVHGIGSGLEARTGHAPLDGTSLFAKLDDQASYSGTNVFYHYCGDKVASVRIGPHKVIYQTPAWDEGTQACASQTICGCHGPTHSPPLVFDLSADPGESSPLDSSLSPVANIIARADSLLSAHLADVQSDNPSNQLENFARPWLFPCCNYPSCQCEEEA